MKKAVLLFSILALSLAGCQDAELENCRAENAELKAKNSKLEEQLRGSIQAIEMMGEQLNIENQGDK